jgi:hypothetical protein
MQITCKFGALSGMRRIPAGRRAPRASRMNAPHESTPATGERRSAKDFDDMQRRQANAGDR